MLTSLAVLSAVAIIATWGLYPLVVGTLAVLRRRRPNDRSDTPPVSVVLVTRDSIEAIQERVQNCWRTGYPRERMEVVIAMDRPVSPTEAAQLRSIAGGLRLVSSSRPGAGKALALNAGVRAARGEVVVFADTHQCFDKSTVPNLIRGLADSRVGAVSGSLHLPEGGAELARRYWGLERWLRRAEAEVHSCVGVTGAVYAIRRALWQDLPEGLLLDDVYTPMHLVLRGHRIGFREDARAYETRLVPIEREYQRKVRTLTGVLQLCAWLPAVLSPFRNPIWLQFLFHKLLRMLTPCWLMLLVAWAAVQLYGLLAPVAPVVAGVLVAVGIWIARSRRPLETRVRNMVFEGVLLQAAVFTAGLNGLRGRWQVWSS